MDRKSPTSIIIPTYREALNITTLVEKIAAVDFQDRAFEVLIVDDCSNDGTEAIIANLQQTHPWLKLLVRHHRPKGLSRSVIDGFDHATNPLLIVMDADLSHPPERLPALLARLDDPKTNMVVGSRYIPGGSTETAWPLTRQIISKVCALFAQPLLHTRVQDPLSGFIGVRKHDLQRINTINPIGWKIGLELMVKLQCQHIVEVPIHFRDRTHGESKLSMRIAMEYIKHLIQLFTYRYVKAS